MLIGADDAAAAIIEISGAGRGTEHKWWCMSLLDASSVVNQ